ncbi:MAG: hypothetical protein ACRDRX_21875 [Pseudonocardiaceae bacterium]
MSGGGWGLVVAVALGLIISEVSELSPWLAHKLIRWAARVRYPTRVEELSALIAERPGKLFKLVTASGFACAALTYRVTHRKTVPVRSVTSRFWIGFGSALVAGALLIGEFLLAFAILDHVNGSDELVYFELVYFRLPELIFLGAIAAFATAAELLAPFRLPAGRATAVVSSALILIDSVVLPPYWPVVGVRPPYRAVVDVEFLIFLLSVGGMAVVAGVSAACAIGLGNRVRFPAMTASSTILGVGLITFSMISSVTMITPDYGVLLVWLLGYGFAFGFSVGIGVLLWQVLCGRRVSQPPPVRVPPTSDMT